MVGAESPLKLGFAVSQLLDLCELIIEVETLGIEQRSRWLNLLAGDYLLNRQFHLLQINRHL